MISSSNVRFPENRRKTCPENEHWATCNRCHENNCEYSAGCYGSCSKEKGHNHIALLLKEQHLLDILKSFESFHENEAYRLTL